MLLARSELGGVFTVNPGADRLIITGRTERRGLVELCANNIVLAEALPHNGRFRFVIKLTRWRIPIGTVLSVRCEQTELLTTEGNTTWRVPDGMVTAGKGQDLLAAAREGLRLNKKGGSGFVNSDELKTAYLKVYNFTRDWFKSVYDYNVLVSHGTLLGIYRNGNLIPGDDDFDCLYLSRGVSASDIVKERVEILERLYADGIHVEVGIAGHVKLKRFGVTVDLMPTWLEGDTLNIASYTTLEDGRRIVENVRSLPFHTGHVYAFADPLPFLEHQYGPDWQQPQPGYRYKRTEAERQNRIKLTPSEFEIAAYGSLLLKRRAGLL